MNAYSIYITGNMNDLPNEDGNYPYTILKVNNKDIQPLTIWAVSFEEVRQIYFNNLNK
jgi:hypothetical protein